LELRSSVSKRDLVFARVGKGTLHRHWAPPDLSNRNWDLQLSTYLDDNAAFTEGDFPLSVDRGTKWDSIFRFFLNSPELLDQCPSSNASRQFTALRSGGSSSSVGLS